MSNLPEKINVQRTITYDVGLVRHAIIEFTDRTLDEVTDQEVIEVITDWVDEDFNKGEGIEQWLTSDGDVIEL